MQPQSGLDLLRHMPLLGHHAPVTERDEECRQIALASRRHGPVSPALGQHIPE